MKCVVEGILPAMITPFTRNGRDVDLEKAAGHAAWLAGKGVHGLFICGTTGEGLLMRPEERRRFVETVIKEVGKRLKIVVQSAALDLPTTCELTAAALASGADAIAAYSPALYQYSDDAIIKYYRAVAKAASGRPVLLYNIPQMTGNDLKPDVVFKLSEVENIVGMKDSSGDLVRVSRLVAGAPKGFAVFNGADEFSYQAYATGIHGSVSGTANFVPELHLTIYDAMQAGDVRKARDAQTKLSRACQLIEYSRKMALYKEGVRLRGGDGGYVRPPQVELSQRERREFERKWREARAV